MAVVTFKVQRTATPAYLSRLTYSPATVYGIYGSQTLLCCVNLSPKLASPDVVSVTQLLPSGTHFLEQYSKARQ